MKLLKLLDKIGWWWYNKVMKFMDKHATGRPISREEMDEIANRYKKMAEENPDQVITEKDK